MRARLSGEAIEVMREMDELKGERDAVADAVRKGAVPLRDPGAGVELRCGFRDHSDPDVQGG